MALTIAPGGAEGLRSEHLLMSAVFQPQQTFGSGDLYPTIPEKAAAYVLPGGESTIRGWQQAHRRLGADGVLDLNGYELWESDDEELAKILEDLG